MTYGQKIDKVMAELNLTKEEAIKHVDFLDWLTEWGNHLKAAHAMFQADMKHKTSFIGFAKLLYDEDREFIVQFSKDQATHN